MTKLVISSSSKQQNKKIRSDYGCFRSEKAMSYIKDPFMKQGLECLTLIYQVSHSRNTTMMSTCLPLVIKFIIAK